MVTPLPINAQIFSGVTFLLKSSLQKHSGRGLVVGQAGCFQPVQTQFIENERERGFDGVLHHALARILLTHPITHSATLRHATAYVRLGYAAQQAIIIVAEYKKGVTHTIAGISGIAPQPTPVAILC